MEEEKMEIENPKSEHLTSSDSDSDSVDDDDYSLSEQLKALESDLSANPSNYDSLLLYIKLLRKMGEIDKLREARENMSALFPLTPDMWQEWAKDEASLSSGTEAFAVVEKLYDRGVFDYLSVPLWCDYLNFFQENDPSVSECSPEGISKARNLFECALTAAGLHVTEGYKIWDAYREFEQAILLTIDEADSKAKEMQIQRIQGIFHRQLSVPLLNLNSTLLAYKAWEAEQGTLLNVESDDLDGLPSHVASAYKKAVEILDARLPHEEHLSKQDISDTEKLQEYMNYLKYEKSVGDPARVQVLYERAIATFPVSSDLWLDYTSYMDKTLKVGKVVRDVYSRATKNCPWVGELWVRYLLSLERGRASEKDISAVFDKSLQCTFSTIEEYLNLFMTRVDGLRRRISSGNESEGEVNYSSIRETFQYASEYFSSHLKNTEAFLQMYTYWARLELNLGKDLAAARKVWESLLKTSGSMLESWKAYIAMEIEWGHVNEARAIYKRCYSKRFPGTGSEDICHSWLRFEREFGTLEDLDRAAQKVGPRLEELKLYQMQQEAKETIGLSVEKDNSMKRNPREKRQRGPSTTDEKSPAKRQKGEQTQKKVDVSEPIRKQHNVNTSEVVAKANSKEKDGTHEKPIENSSTKRKVYTDQCTVFISNLNLKTTDEDLHEFFNDVGGVLSVRVLHDKYTGKSRGLAYVDFSDDEHLAAAVAKNKQILQGKRLSIVRSAPKQNKKGGRKDQKEHGHAPVKGKTNEGSGSTMDRQAPNSDRSKVDNIELKGKNIFAVPRNVRRLGLGATGSSKPKPEVEGDEAPKSNDEFRKMFIKE